MTGQLAPSLPGSDRLLSSHYSVPADFLSRSPDSLENLELSCLLIKQLQFVGA